MQIVNPYEPTSRMLGALAAERGGSLGTWSYLGPLPYWLKGVPPEIGIAQLLGLRPPYDDFGLEEITAQQAKATMAFMASNAMSYVGYNMKPPPTPAAVLEALDAGFAPFGADLRCFSNGDYHLAALGLPQSRGHMPLAGATVDTGAICYNGEVGFAFWGSWED